MPVGVHVVSLAFGGFEGDLAGVAGVRMGCRRCRMGGRGGYLCRHGDGIRWVLQDTINEDV